MTLKTRLVDDMKAAMKAGERGRLDVIRLVNAAIKQREVDERVELDDAQVLSVLEKMLKQRRDSITQFDAAGRTDLSDKERYEVSVIEAYLPAKLSDGEVETLVDQAVREVAPSGPKDMGKVMAALKPKLAGRADNAKVSELVKRRLAALG
jgi:hypothetical protein